MFDNVQEAIEALIARRNKTDLKQRFLMIKYPVFM